MSTISLPPQPTTPLLRATADLTVLRRAWLTVLRNDLDDGELSKAGDAFAADLHNRLQRISEQLFAGTYMPSPLWRVDIEKDDGDVRHLSIPSVTDRVVERALVEVVGGVVDAEFSPWSFGYRRGLGVHDALRSLVTLRDDGAQWVLRADVHDCFDSLDHSQLLHEVEERVDEPALVALIERLLTRPYISKQKAHATTRGAPQGGPLSPMLCNLYLHRLDMRMLRSGHAAIRYADDIAIPVADPKVGATVLARLKAVCEDLKIELGDDKTELCSFAEGFAFLGEEVNARYPEAGSLSPQREPDRKALYVGMDGATVRSRKGRLMVTNNDTDLLSVPISHVGAVTTFGSVGVTAAVRQYALANDVHITFLSRRGSLLGTLRPANGSDPAVLRRQVHATDDSEFATAIARRIVDGKLTNMRTLLLRFAPKVEGDQLLDAAADILKRRNDLAKVDNVAAVMGLEGAGTAAYFGALGLLLPPWANFTVRRRNPPPDPTNALLSYGYTILTGQVTGAVASARLDPSFGFLHSDSRDRPSLALDLVEEFRPLIVDSVVVNVLRRGIVTEHHFRRDERDNAVLLTEAGRRAYLSALEQRMLDTFTHLPSGKKVSYRRALFLQARQLANCILHQRSDYEPVRWRV